MKNVNRRDFLKLSTNSLLALAGLLGLRGLIRYLSYEFDSPPRSEFDIGPEADYPLGSQTVLSHIPAVVLHDKDGFKVMSLTCTHLGCLVKQTQAGFEFPCHGSQFTANGTVANGPATLPLNYSALSIDAEGKVVLDLSPLYFAALGAMGFRPRQFTRRAAE